MSIQETAGSAYEIQTDLPPLFAQSVLLWQQIMSINGAQHIRQMMSQDGRLHPLTEYFKEKTTKGKSEVHPYLSWAIIGASMFQPSAKRMNEIRTILKQGDEQLKAYFEDKILILPVYHDAAPLHGQLYREIFSVRKTYMLYMPYVAYANVWGLPALTIPVAESSEGMPIGIQLISKVGNEDALFQLGDQLEQKYRGYQRCNVYDAVN